MDPKDPIIDELHAIREAIAAACGDDISKIAEAFLARQNSGDREVITLPRKLVIETKAR